MSDYLYQKTEQTRQYWLKASSKLVKCKLNFTQCKQKTEIVIFKSKQKNFKVI